jgi:hypothetical protein
MINEQRFEISDFSSFCNRQSLIVHLQSVVSSKPFGERVAGFVQTNAEQFEMFRQKWFELPGDPDDHVLGGGLKGNNVVPLEHFAHVAEFAGQRFFVDHERVIEWTDNVLLDNFFQDTEIDHHAIFGTE